jgi:hypothetical protein
MFGWFLFAVIGAVLQLGPLRPPSTFGLLFAAIFLIVIVSIIFDLGGIGVKSLAQTWRARYTTPKLRYRCGNCGQEWA